MEEECGTRLRGEGGGGGMEEGKRSEGWMKKGEAKRWEGRAMF
jgi:hypothetical protein